MKDKKGKKVKVKIKTSAKNCLTSIESDFIETFLELARHLEPNLKGGKHNLMGKKLHRWFEHLAGFFFFFPFCWILGMYRVPPCCNTNFALCDAANRMR